MTHQEYMDMLAPYVQKYAKQYGYKVVSPILAQASCESWTGKGLSKLASKYHNYFGMKCGSGWKGKSVNMSTGEEYTVGKITTIRDNFRAYDSVEAGVKGYFEFIQYPRYANLKNATTAQQYLEFIKADGYATSSTYVKTCMSRVNAYNLTQYDNFSTPSKTSSQTAQTTTDVTKYATVRQGDKGEWVLLLQQCLNTLGYKLTADGIFGTNTANAVRKYQLAHKLVVDGIVGQRTWACIVREVA